jgi:dTDP-glucose 4,6-dehydratase/UDP-glucuronate decarboxylase
MYDEAKRYGEAFTLAYAKARGVDSRIIRIFNTYGPHSDPFDGRMVPNFVTRALLNQPLKIYGTGHQTRSLCYISDMVDGLVRAMECENASGHVINLGNPEEHTVLEYSELIRDMASSCSEIIFSGPEVGDDPQRRCPDISKAWALLQWEPQVSLATGLAYTITDLRGALVAMGLLGEPGVPPHLGGSMRSRGF